MSPLNPPLGLVHTFHFVSNTQSARSLFFLQTFRFSFYQESSLYRPTIGWRRKVGWEERVHRPIVFIRFRVETRNGDNLPVNKSPRLHHFSNGITSGRLDEERVASDCVYVRARANYSSERTLCTSRLPIVHEHPAIRDEVASPLLWSDGFAQV